MAFRVRIGKPGNPLFGVAPARLGGGQVQALGHDCAAFSPISSNRPLGRILIRRQIQGCIINSWLVLIAVLGTVIVVADGLTRTPVLEREAYWNGPLEYQPYLGAVLLAGLTLALMFGYVRRAGVSVAEGLFLWFVFCTTAYTRDFSYIHWPGTPLFVTEIVLVLLFLSIYVLAQSRDVHVPLPVNAFLAMLLAAGALSAVRGFLQHSEPILVLRDAALVAYPLFLHIAHNLAKGWLSIKRMAVWFLLGTGLSVLNGFAWFLAAPQERRFIYYGTYILMALVGTFVAIANRLLPPRTGWLLAGLFCLGLALANARTLFVVLPVLLVVGLCAGGMAGRKAFLRPRIALTTFVAAAVLISAVAMLFLRTETGRDFAERSSQELATGVFHSDEDANWQFRLSAWREAWGRFEEYPLAGEGYGIPFAFEMLLFDNDPRPHNTFLTVLYKMGLIGFLPLLALLAYFFWRIIGAAYQNRENPRVAWLWIVVLAVVAFCLYGTANLLLESPFLASLFWMLMGLGLRMARMVDLERILLRPSHEH